MRFMTILGVLLLVGSIGVSAWWFNRAPEPIELSTVDATDIFCTGRVDVAGQVTALEPSQPGRVAKVSVSENESVKEGQEILRLDDTTALIRLAQAESAVEAAKVEFDAAEAEKARFGHQAEVRSLLVAAAAARVDAARKLLDQRREQKAITPLGKAEEKAIEAQVLELEELERAERKQLEEMKDREAKGFGTDLKIRATKARLKSAEADARLAAKAVADCVLKAPGDGTILRVQVSAGGVVGPGSPVPAVVFAPAGPLVLRAEVDQESLGRVAVGQAVEIQDENRPDAPVAKGRIKQVSRWVASRRTHVLEPGEINDVRTVECVVEFDGRAEQFWIGQRMRVKILRQTSLLAPSR